MGVDRGGAEMAEGKASLLAGEAEMVRGESPHGELVATRRASQGWLQVGEMWPCGHREELPRRARHQQAPVCRGSISRRRR